MRRSPLAGVSAMAKGSVAYSAKRYSAMASCSDPGMANWNSPAGRPTVLRSTRPVLTAGKGYPSPPPARKLSVTTRIVRLKSPVNAPLITTESTGSPASSTMTKLRTRAPAGREGSKDTRIPPTCGNWPGVTPGAVALKPCSIKASSPAGSTVTRESRLLKRSEFSTSSWDISVSIFPESGLSWGGK